MTLENKASGQKVNIEGLAAGWYVAALSRHLKNKPLPIRLFGEDLVLWRDGKGGKAVLMDRYCVHQGASLAHGSKIVDGCIECPFHKWQLNAQGRCVVAPGVEQIPQTAVQRTFPTQERYGYIWAWYGTPEPLWELPDFSAAELQKQDFISAKFNWTTKTSCRRVLENNYDSQHFIPVHGLQATSFPSRLLDIPSELTFLSTLPEKARFGVIMETPTKRYVGILGIIAQTLGLNVEKVSLITESWSSGHIVTFRLNNEIRLYVLIGVSPIDQNLTIQHLSMFVKKTGNWALDRAAFLLFGLQSRNSAAQDLPIWDNMEANSGGVYVKYDLTVLKYREFYQRWVF